MIPGCKTYTETMKVPIRKSVTELVIYGKVQIDFILEAIETLNANSSKTSG